MDKVPGTTENGQAQVMQMPEPIVVNMQSCRLIVSFQGEGDARITTLTFLHLSGVMAYTMSLTDEGRAALVRELTGGVLIPSIAL